MCLTQLRLLGDNESGIVSRNGVRVGLIENIMSALPLHCDFSHWGEKIMICGYAASVAISAGEMHCVRKSAILHLFIN
jgi:hypothetical protein